MAYIQKNNPIPRTGCGRRRAEQMKNPFKKINKKSLNKIVGELKKASKLHAGQAEKIEKMTSSPMKKGISGPCKAAAKRKFKVWPSAYASGWGVRCTKAGGPSKYGGSK
tara:strand:- start:12 stop:338 length:327 start_codon:yes stop_codon:yes gene_type:complete